MSTIGEIGFQDVWASVVLAHWTGQPGKDGKAGRPVYRQIHEDLILRELRNVRATQEEFKAAAEELVFRNPKNRPPEPAAFLAVVMRNRKQSAEDERRQKHAAGDDALNFWKQPQAFIDLDERLRSYPPVTATLYDGSREITVRQICCDPERGYCVQVEDVDKHRAIIWPAEVERYEVTYTERVIGLKPKEEAAQVDDVQDAQPIAAALEAVPF